MTSYIDDNIARLGLTIPDTAPPAANYVPAVQTGNLLFISGQISIEPDGTLLTGHLGRDVTVEQGQHAARVCAISILAQTRAALGGDLNRIVRIVRLTGYVASMPDFTDQHLVINGASDLLADVLGESGRHARAAVGTAALPMNVAVEIDAVIEVR
ncbi:MAG: RidA family protein [Alphaproteobacteria bacterium]